MKKVGLVTRVMSDPSGRPLAAVYVPTTPNPTSGYLEIVPVADLVPLDWSIEEAMSFIISGGAVCARNYRLRSSGRDETVTRSGLKKYPRPRRKANKWPRPYGLPPEFGASGVAALGNTTRIPGARRLAITEFRRQRGRGYFRDRF